MLDSNHLATGKFFHLLRSHPELDTQTLNIGKGGMEEGRNFGV